MTLRAHRTLPIALLAAAGATAAAVASADEGDAGAAGRTQMTTLISRAVDGGLPNGASTNAVMSGDRRYARIVAFESEASNLVRGDTNGQKDLFAVRRAGSVNNRGTAWSGQAATLVSRTRSGAPADGASYDASVSGDFRHRARCVAFISRATNLVPGDTNGKADAFVATSPGRAPQRVSPGGARQLAVDVNGVSVSGDCSRVSFTAGGALYTKRSRRIARRVATRGAATAPQYAAGNSNALVYAARGGVWLSGKGTSRGRLVARGGRKPAFNDLKRRTLAYEKTVGGRVQIAYRDVGRRERIISRGQGGIGNGNSRGPSVVNSGFFVTFESEASNLPVAQGSTGDRNGRPDAYLFTDVRETTLIRSVQQPNVPLPGGGRNPSANYYANYLVFDSPAPLGSRNGAHQIYLRYVGGI